MLSTATSRFMTNGDTTSTKPVGVTMLTTIRTHGLGIFLIAVVVALAATAMLGVVSNSLSIQRIHDAQQEYRINATQQRKELILEMQQLRRELERERNGKP